MRSSEVGSAQCRSSKASTTGCDRAPARTQAVIAASCRRRNSSGGELRLAVLPQRNVDQRREQGRVFGRVKADQTQSVLEVGETPLVGRVGAAKAQSAPFGDRVQGRVLQELRRRPIRPRCAASRRGCRETPRSAATCRCPARRRSGRTGPRLRARATSGASAAQARPRGRRAGSSARAPPRRPPPLARTMR